MQSLPDIESMSIQEVVSRIETLTCSMSRFWTSARGWAPIKAAQLLSRSRLDWQVSLARCLRSSLDPPSETERDGKLILAWSNLGSLVEGSLKLFLSIFYVDYVKDVNAIWKRGELLEPDFLQLESLRQFFKKSIWMPDDSWDDWLQHIQQRRNAIHSFRTREIGDFDEFECDIRNYLRFLRYLNERMPYPDDDYVPRES